MHVHAHKNTHRFRHTIHALMWPHTVVVLCHIHLLQQFMGPQGLDLKFWFHRVNFLKMLDIKNYAFTSLEDQLRANDSLLEANTTVLVLLMKDSCPQL